MAIFMVKRLYACGGRDACAAKADVYVRMTCGHLHFVRKLIGKVGSEHEGNYTFKLDVPEGSVVIQADAGVVADVVRLN
ncbi:UNVERIFIED_ORG: hypothetical protein ABIC77_000353 [Stenotrophomonas geniculata]